MEYIFSEHPSVVSQIVAELRDTNIQKDSFRFRENLERLGYFMAYELSKQFKYEKINVTTPLGESLANVISEQLVLATILRAGLPFYQGFIKVFDKAESAFIGAYRVEGDEGSNELMINMEYMAAPSLREKTLIIIDPMLATGKSLVKACKSLFKYGEPKVLHIVAAIASKPGMAYVKKQLPNCNLWIAALDNELNDKAYIVPGLGDAGDLSFGVKK